MLQSVTLCSLQSGMGHSVDVLIDGAGSLGSGACHLTPIGHGA